MVEDLRKISQQHTEQHQSVMKDLHHLKNERDDLRHRLRLAQEDQGRLVVENKELEMKHNKSVEKFEEVEKQWKRIHENLMDQIARQQEQIDGKRALWLDANPGSSARRDAMKSLRDPFHSPLAGQIPRYTAGAMSAMTSPSVTTPIGQESNLLLGTGPPRFGSGFSALPSVGFTANQLFGLHEDGRSPSRDVEWDRKNTGPQAALEMRRGRVPSGMPVQSAYMKNPFLPAGAIYGSCQTFHTEPGTPPHPSRSTALVVHKSDEELAEEFKSAISKLYELIEDWVRKYCCIPNQGNDRAIASGNDVLWDYMMNCTYPGHRQDSHTHVSALLNNPDTRFWFIMRMATQYCVKDIMSIKAFRSYNKGIERTIDTILLKLQGRGICEAFPNVFLS